MTERTEEAGLAGFLTFPVGSDEARLRCLTIDETDVWLDGLATIMSDLPVSDDNDRPEAVMGSLLRSGTRAAVAAIRAYDLDGKLPDEGAMRARMTPTQIHHALEVLMAAAVPFDQDTSRSVATVFGAHVRMLMAGIGLAMLSTLAESTPGVSDAGASATTASARRGRRSSSSSAGPTATSSSRPNGSSIATLLPTA